jgi:hypothetical protein
MTARKTDINGYVEIKGNPISKVGVFQYSGQQMGDGFDPDKIYNVYRPEVELADPACIESFKLVPWIDEHVMLGNGVDGFTPAEKKGVQGVIGEEVYFEDGYLKGNLKIFSGKLADLIKDGKKELSIGYRCIYEATSGVYNGQPYEAVQRQLRGNHLASVGEGRAGPDVSVLDHFKFTFDSKELTAMLVKKDGEKAKDEEVKKEGETKEEGKDEGLTLETLAAQVKALAEAVAELKGAGSAKDEEEPVKEKEEEKVADEEEKEVKDNDKTDAKAMDAKLKKMATELHTLKTNGVNVKQLLAEVSKRDALANKLSYHIGTFDHADKTLDEVAAYGVSKLGLTAEKGQEQAVLAGFFAGSKTHSSAIITAQDSAPKSNQIEAYINGSTT